MVKEISESDYSLYIEKYRDSFETPVHLSLYCSKYPFISEAAYKLNFILKADETSINELRGDFYKLKVKVENLLNKWRDQEFSSLFKEINNIIKNYYLSLKYLTDTPYSSKGFYVEVETQREYCTKMNEAYNYVYDNSLDTVRVNLLKEYKQDLYYLVGRYRQIVSSYYTFVYTKKSELLEIAPAVIFEVDNAMLELETMCEHEGKPLKNTTLYYMLPDLRKYLVTLNAKCLNEPGISFYVSYFFYGLKKLAKFENYND